MWFKLHAEKWLLGSTHYELTPEERSVWIDFLALATIHNPPGEFTFFNFQQLSNQCNVSANLVEKCIKTFEKFDKIEVVDNVISIKNWKKYQSEYQRQKPYRQGERLVTSSPNTAVTKVTKKLHVDKIRIDKIREDKKRIDKNNKLIGISVSESVKRLIEVFYSLLKDFTFLEKPSFPFGQAGKFFRTRLRAGDTEETLTQVIKYFFYYPSDFAEENAFSFSIFQKEFNRILKQVTELAGEPIAGLLEEAEKRWLGKKAENILKKD